ncbi:MAG: tRNA (N(6)-L-threonylcarbamoyladenosine(37)-C(2))-methylthiotransferase MtaB [Deltaproteobacteria bacterium]|nr:tRNA (N(6)-L-threonylcarbamoyladenosine(37)-C(2))-methylthiotransferase MtaB [Deltaproteobacteria bacterium]
MDVYLTTLGCRLNEAELERWGSEIATAGHRVVREPAQAQLVVLNSCAVTAEAARKSRKLVRRLHRQNPAAKLVLTGCYATLAPEEAAELAGVDLVLANRDKDRLVEAVADRLDLATMPAQAQAPRETHLYRSSRTRAFVKVQDGCRNRCTFCIVTVARGDERSRPIAEVVADVRALEAQGRKEAVLTGVHLGGYGQELGTDLRALVEALLAETTIPRLRLSSLEPWDLPDDFFSLWREPRLCPHLHLPLQSGSDAVLRRMARHGDAAHYRALVASARAQIPELNLTTDVMVGFPGETDEDFRATLDLLRELRFSHLHIFAYSRRQGTAAARMSDQVPEETKRARSQAAHQLAAELRSALLARAVGQTRPVLWEGEPRELPDGRWGYEGFTDQYLTVRAAVPAGIALENVITPTALVAAEADYLRGEIPDAAHPQGGAP